MGAPDDPLNPEAWYAEPGVCGSCVAWRPIDRQPEDDVAVGLCRLRPELRRVPASLAKCPKYNQRGGFTYRPGANRTESSRRRRAAQAVVKRRNDAGELIDVTPAPRPAKESPTRKPVLHGDTHKGADPEGRVEAYVFAEPPTYRPFPPPDRRPPERIDLGELTAPLAEAALTDLLREEVYGRPRDMASKYRHGGRVRAVAEDGEVRTVPAHRFFAKLERLAKTLDALEEAIETHPKLQEEIEDLLAQLRRARGSFTTFNLLFADRSDHFTGKA